jgi:hypothetical protein
MKANKSGKNMFFSLFTGNSGHDIPLGYSQRRIPGGHCLRNVCQTILGPKKIHGVHWKNNL